MSHTAQCGVPFVTSGRGVGGCGGVSRRLAGPPVAHPCLYGNLLATGKAAGGVFSDDFFFDLSAKSDVTGLVGMFFGTVSFSSVLIDGNAPVLSFTPTGYGFNFSGLAAGAHTTG